MSLLIDTQIAIWWHVDHPRLNRGGRDVVESEPGEVWLSRGSLWEVAIKVASGKLPISAPDFAAQMEDFGFRWLQINNRHLLDIASMPVGPHKDPFDRLLAAQSLELGWSLLSKDTAFDAYGVRRIWA